jgi:hypothetical protein
LERLKTDQGILVSFQYSTLLHVARTLQKTPSLGEEFDRSAINRAYYCIYGEARALAMRHGWTWNGKGNSHQQMWNFLKSGGTRRVPWERALMKSIGDAGAALKDIRTSADYKSEVPVTPDDARDHLIRAADLLKRITGAP